MKIILQKGKSLLRYWNDPQVSKMFIVRYALGQLLSLSGLGKYISFQTKYYKLFLTASPVALVLFGGPQNEREEDAWLDTVVSRGDVVIDAGANIGTFSLKASSLVGEEGRVISIEAHPGTASVLRRNIARNERNNITVLQKALGDKNEMVHFSEEIYDDVNHVVTEGGVVVEACRLDDVPEIKQIAHIKCLKIDIEGYELMMLRGAADTIKKTEHILFEAYQPNCERFGYAVDDLFAWFLERGRVLRDLETGKEIDCTTAGRKSVYNAVASKK